MNTNHKLARRTVGLISGALGLGLLFGAAAPRPAITDADWHQFVFNGRTARIEPENYSLEYFLVGAGRAEKTRDEAIAAASTISGLSIPEVTRRTGVYIQAANHERKCREGSDLKLACRLEDDTALLSLLSTQGAGDPSGCLLNEVWDIVEHDDNWPAFAKLASAHPRGKAIITMERPEKIDDYVTPSHEPSQIIQSLDRLMDGYEWRRGDPAEFLSYMTWLTDGLPGGPARQFSQAILLRFLIHYGLDTDALSLFDGMTRAQRKALTTTEGGLYDSLDRYCETKAVHFSTILLDLASLLIERKRTGEALALIETVRSMWWSLDGHTRNYVRLLEELINPELEEDEIFDAFVLGYPRISVEALFYSLDPFRSPLKGYINQIKQGPVVINRLSADYLAARGFSEMAASVMDMSIRRMPSNLSDPVKAEMGKTLPELRAAFDAKLAAVEQTFGTKHHQPTPDVSGLLAQLTSAVRPSAFVERPVSDLNAETAKPADPQDYAQLGLDYYQIVRTEQKDDALWIVYQSQALDPVGEVSMGGYWLWRSDDGGASWHAPLYLGLQALHPYIIDPKAQSSMIGDNRLTLEAERAELDPDSITFPPVGLRIKNRKTELFLDFDLSKLSQDADADGLTDIAEHRMGLDPLSSDTDGDGLSDGSDSLPTVRFNKDAGGSQAGAAILGEILNTDAAALIVGIEQDPETDKPMEEKIAHAMGQPRPAIPSDRTLFIIGNPGFFSALQPPFRVIVQTPDHAEALGAHYGVHYPTRVSVKYRDLDNSRLVVNWSASWQGGTLLLTKSRGGYKVRVLSRWIT